MADVFNAGQLDFSPNQEMEFGYPTSTLWLMAMGNDAEAQNCLGICFLDGKGIAPNNRAAYYWFKSACNNGCLNALSNLAYMYLQGIHVEKNYDLARFLIEEAVSRGCPHAENNLGVLHSCGLIEDADASVAKVSFAIAASKGVQAAQLNMLMVS